MENIKWDWWIAWGLVAQALFTGRFLIQWLTSEKKKKSVIPTAFWFFSVGGAAMLLTYAIKRADPIFILGQSFGFVVYLRNIRLIDKEKIREGEEGRVLLPYALMIIAAVAFMGLAALYIGVDRESKAVRLEPIEISEVSAQELISTKDVSGGFEFDLALPIKNNSKEYRVYSRYRLVCYYVEGRLLFSRDKEESVGVYEYRYRIP